MLSKKTTKKTFLEVMYFNFVLEQKGSTLSTEEQEYLNWFIDLEKIDAAKHIYYNAIYMFKNHYPRIIVYWYIKRKTKLFFNRTNAPLLFHQIHKDLAKFALHHALRFYCRHDYRQLEE